MTYKAAIIGCGKIGCFAELNSQHKGIYTHAAAYKNNPNINLISVCDVDINIAKLAAKNWEVTTYYNNTNDLLEFAKPEIVSICTPDQTHASILKKVLYAKSVRAVVIEKPIALDVDEAEFLVTLAKKKKITLFVNYLRRYCGTHLKIKEEISSGRFGSIKSINGYYTKGIFKNGTHWIDLARWFLGEIKDCISLNIGSELDPSLDALFNFENGSTGFLKALDANQYSLFEMDIIGSLGRVRLLDSGHKLETYELQESPYYAGYQTILKTHEEHTNLHDSFKNCIEDVVNCLQNSIQPRCSGDDGLAAIKIAQRLSKAAYEHY